MKSIITIGLKWKTLLIGLKGRNTFKMKKIIRRRLCGIVQDQEF